MTAGGGHFQGALGTFLALDVVKIERGWRRVLDQRFGRAEQLAALGMIDQGQKSGGGQHFDPAILVRRPGGLGTTCRRTDQAQPALRRVQRRRQHTGNPAQGTVQRQFTKDRIAGDHVGRQHIQGGQKGQRDRQIVMAAFLQNVGRRQVDGDAFGRQGKSQRMQGGAHSLAALADRLVRQSDQRERWQTTGDLDLDVDRQHIDTLERHRVDTGDHNSGNGSDVCIANGYKTAPAKSNRRVS